MNTPMGKILSSGITLLVLLALATGAAAFRGGDGFGGGPMGGKGQSHMESRWWLNQEISGLLSLSQEQKTELEALYKGRRVNLIDLLTLQKKAMVFFEDALDSEFSEADAQKKLNDVLDAKKNLEAERMNYLIKVRKVLSLDQFRKLTEYGQELHREHQREPHREKGVEP